MLRPQHMFPSLATPENMTHNNVSATMFPSLARALYEGWDANRNSTIWSPANALLAHHTIFPPQQEKGLCDEAKDAGEAKVTDLAPELLVVHTAKTNLATVA